MDMLNSSLKISVLRDIDLSKEAIATTELWELKTQFVTVIQLKLVDSKDYGQGQFVWQVQLNV